MSLRLLDKDLLVRTSSVDHADWNFGLLLGPVQKLRFRLINRLLGAARYPRLLEVGYGSGVFMPELRLHCDELFGADPHPFHDAVTASLRKANVDATLVSAGVQGLPFPDAYFDCVVGVSCLEYVEDLPSACLEIRRVLKPGGHLIAVTPGCSPLLDFALRQLTGEDPAQYGDRRSALLPTLRGQFRTLREVHFPPIGGSVVRMYTAVKLQSAP